MVKLKKKNLSFEYMNVGFSFWKKSHLFVTTNDTIAENKTKLIIKNIYI